MSLLRLCCGTQTDEDPSPLLSDDWQGHEAIPGERESADSGFFMVDRQTQSLQAGIFDFRQRGGHRTGRQKDLRRGRD